MRSLVTAVIAAIEAVAAAALGLTVVVLPALLLWAITFELAAEPSAVFAGAAAVWSLAHFAPLTLVLSPELALGFGLPAEQLTVLLSLAPLGLTLLTALLAVRAGWRLGARGGTGAAGLLGGALGFGAAAGIVAALVGPLLAWPAPLAGLIAGLVYGVPAAISYLVRAARDEHPWWRSSVRSAQRGLERLGTPGVAALPLRAAEALRLAAGAFAGLIGLGGVTLAIALIAGFGEITALTQHLQLDPLGSILLFLVQLALLPIALVWGIAWLTGAGFAVGAGTSVSPFETLLGPLPALPLFGAIPQGWGALGALAPALVVLTGIGVAALLGQRSELRRASWPVALGVAAVAAVLTGLGVTALSALAVGSIGPDRLAETGPAPWLVGGLAAAELGAGLLLGTAAARIDAARVREMLPEGLPGVLGGDGGPRGERAAGAAADAQETVPLTGLPALTVHELHEVRAPGAEAADPGAAEYAFAVEYAAEQAAELAAAHMAQDDAAETANTEAASTEAASTEAASTEDGNTGEYAFPPARAGLDPEPAEAPAPIGELYDQETAPIDPLDSDARGAEAAQAADGDDPAERDPAAERAALAAYAWDESATGEVEPPERDRRPGWRLRGPGR